MSNCSPFYLLVSEELKEPEKTLPWGGFIGLLAVSMSYLLANVTYLMLFSVPQIMESSTIAMVSCHGNTCC